VATSSISRLLDYAMNTPADGFRSAMSVNTVCEIISNNAHIKKSTK
jgi:4-O-beta-D-mannosyl-D-glucose phosphorylase